MDQESAVVAGETVLSSLLKKKSNGHTQPSWERLMRVASLTRVVEIFLNCSEMVMEAQESASKLPWMPVINMLVSNTEVSVGLVTLSASMARDPKVSAT